MDNRYSWRERAVAAWQRANLADLVRIMTVDVGTMDRIGERTNYQRHCR